MPVNRVRAAVERQLSRSLLESATRLGESQLARALFGDIVVERYAATRTGEARAFRQHISDGKMSRHVEII